MNLNVVVWLLAGGMIGSLGILLNGFTMLAIFLSFIAAMVSLGVFHLIRGQPVR
jgi:hypothetical protein